MEHDGLEVVVEDTLRHATEELEGASVHGEEGFEPLVEGEVDEDRSRPRHHHGERRERALRGADAEVAERAPVDLGLLAGLGFDAQVGLARPRGADLSDVALEDGDAAGEAAAA